VVAAAAAAVALLVARRDAARDDLGEAIVVAESEVRSANACAVAVRALVNG
jgi:hypothetical protein